MNVYEAIKGNLKDIKFDGVEFEKNLPHNMRFKEYHTHENDNTVPEGTLYWVTQEAFNKDDLEKFQEALRNSEFNEAYVTLRDLSCYSFIKDKDNNVFAVVNKDSYDAGDYIDSMTKEWSDFSFNGEPYKSKFESDNSIECSSFKEDEEFDVTGFDKGKELEKLHSDDEAKIFEDFQLFLNDHNITKPTEDDINDYFSGLFYDIETHEDLDYSNKAEELIRAKYLGECGSSEIKEANTNSLYITTEELIAYANQFLSSIGCKAIISPDKKIMVEVPVDKTDAWIKLHDKLNDSEIPEEHKPFIKDHKCPYCTGPMTDEEYKLYHMCQTCFDNNVE